MSLFSNPQEHAENPPSSWTVEKRGRKWHLCTLAGHTLVTHATKHGAEQLRTAGFIADLYARESRWYAGESIPGWKPYAKGGCDVSKHTPGPWSVINEDTVRGPSGNVVAECCGYSNRSENPAHVKQGCREDNARLIAAAPDLLAALERLLLCPALNMDELHEYDIEAIDIAYAAIRKAVSE